MPAFVCLLPQLASSPPATRASAPRLPSLDSCSMANRPAPRPCAHVPGSATYRHSASR
jgi:hypothetical protein